MAFLAKFRVGDGTFERELRSELEAEGMVFLEEGLPGAVRYHRFRMPGRRHHGRVTRERIAIAITERRITVYCRSGSVELIDSPFSDPRVALLDVSRDGAETIVFRIDYDRAELPDVSGQITIEARSPNAATVVEHLRARINGG